VKRISFSLVGTTRIEFECETPLIAKTPETCFRKLKIAYQIFERMTSFFLFFLGSSVAHIVFGRLRRGYGAPGEKPIHLAGGTRCPQRVGKQMRLRRLTSEGGWLPRSFIRRQHESL
jgi:hypothetical protein